MANTIRIKRSTGSSNPTSLENAEVAFREGDEVLVIGKGTGGAGGSATSIEAIGGKGAFFDKATTRNANIVLAGPTTGSAAAPTFRALVAGDLLKLNEFTAPDGSVSLNSQKITNLATPTANGDAASKSYVDGVSQGLDIKEAVKVATTANITLSGTQTIDGVSVSADERVLVKDQSTATENGLYLCKASSWTRTDDLAAGSDASSVFVFVDQGTVNSENGFVCTSSKGSAVVDTNNLSFTQFSGAGQITASDGLSKSGNTLSVDLKSNGGLVIESSKLALDLAASSITGTLPVTKLTSLTATVSELNILDGVTATASELNIMDGVTASTSELNIMDGVTATTSELNFTDGVTSNIQTQLDSKLDENSTINGGSF
tara:strand:- start:1945 stop:3069 length:1125 start_codon:yes stop_codon:yes gene_type:complete